MVSCVLMFKVASAGKRIRNDVRTAFMPFSCCAALRNMMVRSCQRTLRSAKSSHGFLACTPLRLFFSFSMSSRSPSQSALPCSCFRAVHRKTHGVKSAVFLVWPGYRVCWCESGFQTGSFSHHWQYQNDHMLLPTVVKIKVSASGDSREGKRILTLFHVQ